MAIKLHDFPLECVVFSYFFLHIRQFDLINNMRNQDQQSMPCLGNPLHTFSGWPFNEVRRTNCWINRIWFIGCWSNQQWNRSFKRETAGKNCPVLLWSLIPLSRQDRQQDMKLTLAFIYLLILSCLLHDYCDCRAVPSPDTSWTRKLMRVKRRSSSGGAMSLFLGAAAGAALLSLVKKVIGVGVAAGSGMGSNFPVVTTVSDRG